MANRPVHQQVWITTNGGCEMGVRLKCQAKMPLIIAAVYRLTHGAQDDGLNYMVVWPIFDFL